MSKLHGPEVIAMMQFPHAADGNLYLVLRRSVNGYVVHTYNAEQDAFFWGTYIDTYGYLNDGAAKAAAVEVFMTKCGEKMIAYRDAVRQTVMSDHPNALV